MRPFIGMTRLFVKNYQIPPVEFLQEIYDNLSPITYQYIGNKQGHNIPDEQSRSYHKLITT